MGGKYLAVGGGMEKPAKLEPVPLILEAPIGKKKPGQWVTKREFIGLSHWGLGSKVMASSGC